MRLFPRATILFATLAVLASAWPAFAQDLRLLNRAERKAYHACVFAAWIQDYCHKQVFFHVLDYAAAFDACVVASSQGRLSPSYADPYFIYVAPLTRTTCWAGAQGPRLRVRIRH